MPVFPSDSHRSVNEHWPPGRLCFLCTATLENPRVPRGFHCHSNDHPDPLPTPHFPFLCPKFPCQARPCSRAYPSRAATQSTPVSPRQQRVHRAQVVGHSHPGIPASRAATGDRSHSAAVTALPLCTTTLQNPRAPRGFSLERGCVRGAPAAAAGSQGTARISPVACGDSGPLRLVLGGHSRAPWVAAPPPWVHRFSVVHLPWLV